MRPIQIEIKLKVYLSIKTQINMIYNTKICSGIFKFEFINELDGNLWLKYFKLYL